MMNKLKHTLLPLILALAIFLPSASHALNIGDSCGSWDVCGGDLVCTGHTGIGDGHCERRCQMSTLLGAPSNIAASLGIDDGLGYEFITDERVASYYSETRKCACDLGATWKDGFLIEGLCQKYEVCYLNSCYSAGDFHSEMMKLDSELKNLKDVISAVCEAATTVVDWGWKAVTLGFDELTQEEKDKIGEDCIKGAEKALELRNEFSALYNTMPICRPAWTYVVSKEPKFADSFLYELSKLCEGGKSGLKQYDVPTGDDEKKETGFYCVGKHGEYIMGIADGCKTVPQMVKEESDCFFCPIFAKLYNAADEMAYHSFEQLGEVFAIILVMCLAVWIAFITLNHVSNLTKQDAPKYLGNIIKQSFKVLFAFLLLMNANEVYKYAVNPLIRAGLNMGTHLINTVEIKPTISEQVSNRRLSFYRDLEGFVMAVQTKIAIVQAIGKNLICVGSNNLMSINFGMWGASFYMIVQGALIAAFAFLISLSFGFYVIDAVVQVGIVGGLMPFIVLSWPFKLTSKFTTKGLDILINSCFVFIFMATAININFELIGHAMGQKGSEDGICGIVTNSNGKEEKRINCDGTCGEYENDEGKTQTIDCGAFDVIYHAINTSDWKRLSKATDLSSTQFLILLACAIFGFKLVAQVSGLAGQMASGAIKDIGSSIAKMGASAVKGFAKSAMSVAGKSVGLDKLGSKISTGIQNASSTATSAVLHSPITAAKYAVNSDYRKQVNHKVADKFDKVFKTNTTAEHKNQKSAAKSLADASGGKASKRDKNGNRSVELNGASATIDSKGNISGISSNVQKTQNKDGSYSYKDSKTGENLSEKKAFAREEGAEKLQNAAANMENSGGHAGGVGKTGQDGQTPPPLPKDDAPHGQSQNKQAANQNNGGSNNVSGSSVENAAPRNETENKRDRHKNRKKKNKKKKRK